MLAGSQTSSGRAAMGEKQMDMAHCFRGLTFRGCVGGRMDNEQASPSGEVKEASDRRRWCGLSGWTWVCKSLNWQLPWSFGNTWGAAWGQRNERLRLGMAKAPSQVTLRISGWTGGNGLVVLVSDQMAGKSSPITCVSSRT